uniref:Uncharacterized protein n=1 Tax=Glossina palpalis gambiensis TaxID=67801 RepID=A0A1B0BH75_9MUSC
MAKNVAQCYYNQLNVTSSYIKKTCFKANNEALYTELSVVDWSFYLYYNENYNIFLGMKLSPSVSFSSLCAKKFYYLCGRDGIRSGVLVNCADVLINPIKDIFNFSLSSGVVPDVWKCNYILLVEKCGSTQVIDNYRVGLYSERYKSFVTQCNPLRLYLLLLKCLVLAALANASLVIKLLVITSSIVCIRMHMDTCE